jgi:hypothetical protein
MSTTPDFELVKRLCHLSRENEGKEGDLANDRLDRTIPGELDDILFDIADIDGPEFEQAFRDFYNEPTNGTKPRANTHGKSNFKRAKRASRSPEVWRILRNYPEYEISSHGRVRSLTRAVGTDWLKPRFVWYYGKVVVAVKLSVAGKPIERFIGPLMIQAGFLKEPKWMAKKKAGIVGKV